MDPIHVPFKLGGQTVPGVWRFLLPDDLLRSEFPEERRATCGGCPMVEADGYRPDYRCCTYHPRIPNFLLGLALSRAVSGAAVRDLIARGFVVPEGTERTPAGWAAALRQAEAGQYGKGDGVLCPLLDPASGFCRVHAYRNGVCSTYFCLYDFGARSSRFWEVLQEYVTGVETALAQWSLAEAGFDLGAYFRRFDDLAANLGSGTLCNPLILGQHAHAPEISRLQSVPDPNCPEIGKVSPGWSGEALDHLWGHWRGREVELLTACADAVSTHRDRLKDIAAATPIRRPAVFEAAEAAALPPDLALLIDPRDAAAGEAEELPPAPIVAWGELAVEALGDVWALPPTGALIALDPGVRFTAAAIHFAPQEGEAEWELSVTTDVIEALRHFGEARAMTPELLTAAPLAALPEPRRFLAEWLGYEVLIEV